MKETKLDDHGIIKTWDFPIYWGSKNTYPTKEHFIAGLKKEHDIEYDGTPITERYLKGCVGCCGQYETHYPEDRHHYHPCDTPGRGHQPIWELDLFYTRKENQ